MEEDRIKHSLAVANKMIELNNGENAEELFLLGYLHDIGYKFTADGSIHNKVGGEILRNLGFKHWKELKQIYDLKCDETVMIPYDDYQDLLNNFLYKLLHFWKLYR